MGLRAKCGVCHDIIIPGEARCMLILTHDASSRGSGKTLGTFHPDCLNVKVKLDDE